MAEPKHMDGDMIGIQFPRPDVNTLNDETMTGDGEEEAPTHHFVSDHEEALAGEDGSGEEETFMYDDENEDVDHLTHHGRNSEEEIIRHECLDEEEVVVDDELMRTSAEPQDQSVQYENHQEEDIRQFVEEDLESESGMPDRSEVEPTLEYRHESIQEHGDTHMDDAQDKPQDMEVPIHKVHEPQGTAEDLTHDVQDEQQEQIQAGRLSAHLQVHSDFRAAHVEDNHRENDSSTLFVSEYESPLPSPACRPGSSVSMPPPVRPSARSRQAIPGTSTFAKIRNMQRKLQDRKNAAQRSPTILVSNANPDNEAYLEAVLPRQSPSTAPLEVDEDEKTDKKATAEFQKQRRHYEDIKNKNGGHLPFRQDVEWMKIKGAEDARRKKRLRDIAKAREEEGEPDLFPEVHDATNDDQDDESDDTLNVDVGPSKRRIRELPRKSANLVTMRDAELQSMRVGLEAERDQPRKKTKKGASADDGPRKAGPSSRGRGSKTSASRPSRAKAAPKKPTKGRRTAKDKREVNFAVRQATSLFNSNVFVQQAGASAVEQPTFRSRVKADALKELIASVPLEDQKKAKGDMSILLAATKDFDGRGAVKSDGFGLWLVKGMKTSLKGYQVLGTAFMRRRENAAEEPKGGLMADQMGLGKTLMMLANIVNGQPATGAKGARTTLLVASPALLTQWKNEIEQHTDKGLRIMRYGAGTRIDSNQAYDILASHDIILTTYTEIMKSYPKNEPPIECQTAEQKIAWWREVYEQQRGVLHRMMFLRIVLDEAQAIKNHMGRTSIACRALMAHHKWALSGTPILNSLTELYPYFKFLGVPHTGSFKIFKHNYCDTGDAENTERLLVRLSQFMIRRTHADELFGAPILKLPQADQHTYWCEFNSVERCIYDIVRSRFAKSINMWAKRGELEKSYSNALVMLLRLRQLTAHVLMLQFVMRDLLEREDIERIKLVVSDQAADLSSRNGKTILAIRKQLEQHARNEKKKSAAKAAAAAAKRAAKKAGREVDDDINSPLEDDDEAFEEEPVAETEEFVPQTGGRGGSGGQFGKEYNFKPFLSSLKTGDSWEKAKKKAKCGYCGGQPRDPYMTSCGHLICREPCLTEADLEAAEQEKQHAACKACGITPLYIHPCEPDDEDSQEAVAQGTRSQAKKKKDKERKRREDEDIAEDWLTAVGDEVLPSAKTIAVKAQILNWTKENPRVKIIIYTQFLAMIRILARICQQEGWQVEQYHGKMSLFARDKAIGSFAENPNIKVMLASLRCGGLGLNLTMASKVIMIDPWWNSASEQQAFCRVFRIGQKEETFMSRLCVRNTVDQHLISMQERKQEEIDAVMNDDGTKAKKMSIRDLMKLFGNLEEDPDGKPFIMVDNPDPRGGFRADRDDEGYADEL